MLNLLKKTTPWMVASLFVATAVFAQDGSCPKPCPTKCEPKCEPRACPPKPCPKPCPQPCPPTQICPDQDPCCPAWPTPVLNAAYNYPARMQTRCPWDFDFNASFIYWQPLQENMELGVTNLPVAGAATQHSVANMKFDYKPGFQIGVGGYFDYDGWDTQLEYTWFHNTNSTSVTAPTGGTVSSLWGIPTATTFHSISESWNLKMDIIDLDLGRWYYVGTKLTFRPNFGGRAAWIRESASVNHFNSADVNVRAVSASSSSWAIGIKTGLDTKWMIGSGFRLYGCGEGDLLFTKYTRLSTKTNTTPTDPTTAVSVKQKKVFAVKPHLDLELGFGWGTYLDCNNWYMDFALGYGFQVFFDQNMFRHYNDDVHTFNSQMPNGNLYVHGMTLRAGLDF